jgi:hypothetical protein
MTPCHPSYDMPCDGGPNIDAIWESVASRDSTSPRWRGTANVGMRPLPAAPPAIVSNSTCARPARNGEERIGQSQRRQSRRIAPFDADRILSAVHLMHLGPLAALRVAAGVGIRLIRARLERRRWRGPGIHHALRVDNADHRFVKRVR